MLGRGRRHAPLAALVDEPGADVLGQHHRRPAGQRAATVHVNALAQRCVDARFPVVNEGAVLSEQALGDRLGQRRAIDAELILLADALVPATEQEAGVVDVVVEVMVREEQVVDARGQDTDLHELGRRRRAAVEHQILAAHVDGEGRPPAIRRGRRSAGAEDEHLRHDRILRDDGRRRRTVSR